MNGHVITPAYGLFQQLGQLALMVFSDVIELRGSGLLRATCPYSVSEEDSNAIVDPARWTCVTKIASSPRFPWQLTDLRPALRRAELWMHQDPTVRRTTRGDANYAQSTLVIQQVLLLARRMVLVSPQYAKLAFGLNDAELNAISDAADAAMVEASSHVRLTFRSAQYRDVLRTYSAIDSRSPSKDVQRLLGSIARLSGLGAPKVI